MKIKLFLFIILAQLAHAQLWSPVLATSRANDWTTAGATIVNRTTACTTSQCNVLCGSGAPATCTSSGATLTTASIQAAISSAPSNTVIRLPAATFSVSAGIDFNGKSNVTLRGMGPTQTIVNRTGSASGIGGDYDATVVVRGSGGNNGVTYPGSETFSHNWTSGYTPGTSTITLDSVSGMAVGTIAVLDQLSDTAADDTGFALTCPGCTVEGGGGGWSRSGRTHVQVVRITAIAGSTVTIDPPVISPNWKSGKSPQIYGSGMTPAQNVGIEDMRINGSGTTSTKTADITFAGCYSCWAKNVTATFGGKGAISMFQNVGLTIRDSYLYQSLAYDSENYGIQGQMTSRLLVENNIIQKLTSGPVFNGGVMGCVIAYNYIFMDDFSNGGGDWWPGIANHENSADVCLYEGNQAPGIREDDIHGTHFLQTVFRNYFTGNDPTKTQTPRSGPPINLDNIARMYNFVGNVLGTTGVNTTYTPGIFDFSTASSATSLRWGNYDVVNAANRFLCSEVPSGLAQFSNPCPASQTLPASFYLSAKPSFFGSNTWPPIGPDVTGGDVSGYNGHVYRIPARVAYEAATKDGVGGMTNFDANVFYAPGSGPALSISPPPPVAFSQTLVGQLSSPQSITLTNTGGSNVTSLVITIVGTNPSDFAITTTCTSTITPSSSCTVTATFRPQSIGDKTASIQIASNVSGSPQTVSMTGNGRAQTTPAIGLFASGGRMIH